MDISTVIGVIGGFGMVIFSIAIGGVPFSAFWNLPGFLLVVVGSYFGLFTLGSVSSALGVFRTIGITFKVPNFNERGIIAKLMAMSEKARSEGLLALEEEMNDLEDEFLKKGLRLVIDGTDTEIVRTLMENELNQIQMRHVRKIGAVNMLGSLAPAVGMLGTVVGLIGMLRNLEDKSALGPNMAVALITTFYGSIVANFMMIPWSAKLKDIDAQEVKTREMAIEGILSIQAGDNPRILGLKLLSYLEPADRSAVEAEIMGD